MVELHPRWIEAARFSGRWSFGPLVEVLGGAEAFEQATLPQLIEAGAPVRIAESLNKAVSGGSSEAGFTRVCDPDYPARLLGLPKPPPVIWWRGDLRSCVRVQGLAVVGARACTGYGRKLAYRLGSLEAASGGVLISGAARGIDRAAHQGAQEFGRTVAVLGGGLGTSMSSTQRKSLDDILNAGGALMSEFPPAQSPTRWSFPQRNRLVAALCRAVVVVEATKRSGAAITAAFARDLGRDVYAVPGRIDSPTSQGCHRLIAEGARVTVRITDPIWERSLKSLEALPLVLRLLMSGPLSCSELQRRSQMDSEEFRKALGRYEFSGLVERLPGAQLSLA